VLRLRPVKFTVLCRTKPRCAAASETMKDMGNADDTHLALPGPQHARTRKLEIRSAVQIFTAEVEPQLQLLPRSDSGGFREFSCSGWRFDITSQDDREG